MTFLARGGRHGCRLVCILGGLCAGRPCAERRPRAGGHRRTDHHLRLDGHLERLTAAAACQRQEKGYLRQTHVSDQVLVRKLESKVWP